MAPPKFKPVSSFVTWAKFLNLPHFSFPKSMKQGPEHLPLDGPLQTKDRMRSVN